MWGYHVLNENVSNMGDNGYRNVTWTFSVNSMKIMGGQGEDRAGNVPFNTSQQSTH